jgi:flavodoxin
MNTKDTLILCSSRHHGNTQTVAERISGVLDAVIADPVEAMAPTIGDYQLIGVGSGVYYGRFHKSMRRWLHSLPKDIGVGREAFVFSTSGLPFLSHWYHRSAVSVLRRKGFDVIGEFSCSGHDSFGPLWLFGGINRRHPNERDLERAEGFTRELHTTTASREQVA